MAKNAASSTAKVDANTLPLFFKKPAAVDAARHGEAGLKPQENMGFAANTNSIFINMVEFPEAAKYYPIVFSDGDAPMPAVIAGLENKNYFVGADKRWKKDTYIPAYVRRYPFVFMEMPDSEEYILCVDEAAEHFQKKAGKNDLPLYVGGTPSELALNALDFCRAFQQQYDITREFSAAVKAAGLLTSTRSDAKLQNGREIRMSGFQVIDEAKFSKLPELTIMEFHKKGWLPALYFMLMSATNWRNLIALAAEVEK